MNNIEKAQYILQGKCWHCKEPKETHQPSNCRVARQEFSLEMDKIFARYYKEAKVVKMNNDRIQDQLDFVQNKLAGRCPRCNEELPQHKWECPELVWDYDEEDS